MELQEAFRQSKDRIGLSMSDVEKKQLTDQALGDLFRAQQELIPARMRIGRLAEAYDSLSTTLKKDGPDFQFEKYKTADWFGYENLATAVESFRVANHNVESARKVLEEMGVNPKLIAG